MGNDSRRKAAVRRRLEIRSKSPVPPALCNPPRFVADVMLGRLTKWLRIAGFDVLYSNRYTDDELVAVSLQDGRILLSRDTRLLIRKAVRQFIFLESEKIDDQIRQIFRTMQTTTLPDLLGRCVSCNNILSEAPRDKVRGSVPSYVYETQACFKSCPQCRKVYWAGTHRQFIIRTLEQLALEGKKL